MPSRLQKLLGALPEICRLWATDKVGYLGSLYVRATLGRLGVSVDPTARVHSRLHLLDLAPESSLGAYSVVMAVETAECREAPLLRIGPRTYVGDHTNIRAAGGRITIGAACLVANGVTIVASNHGTAPGTLMMDQRWRRGDVTIEDDVWLGAGVVVLPGAHVKRGAVIAAGAVVRGEVPEGAVYGGIPARQISERHSEAQ